LKGYRFKSKAVLSEACFATSGADEAVGRGLFVFELSSGLE